MEEWRFCTIDFLALEDRDRTIAFILVAAALSLLLHSLLVAIVALSTHHYYSINALAWSTCCCSINALAWSTCCCLIDALARSTCYYYTLFSSLLHSQKARISIWRDRGSCHCHHSFKWNVVKLLAAASIRPPLVQLQSSSKNAFALILQSNAFSRLAIKIFFHPTIKIFFHPTIDMCFCPTIPSVITECSWSALQPDT